MSRFSGEPDTMTANHPVTRRRPPRLALALALLLALPAAAAAQEPAATPDPLAELVLPSVVARVGDVEVTRAELLTQARLMRAQVLRATGRDPAQEEGFLRIALDGLVEEALLYLDSRQRGTAATDAEVGARIAAMEATFDTPAAFDQALAAQGSDRTKLRAQLHQALSVEKALAEAAVAGQQVSDEEKRTFYREHQAELTLPQRYKLRHILIAHRGGDGAAKLDDRIRAEQALARIRSGEDFATVAAEVSEDAATRERGGELPWVTPSGGAGSALDEAVAKLEPGGRAVVETERGFHVIELLERRPEEVMPYAEAEPRIEAILREQGGQRVVAERVRRLREETPIEILI